MLFIWESNKREKEQTTVRTKTANKDGKKKKSRPRHMLSTRNIH